MAGGAPTSFTPKKAAAAIRGCRGRPAPDKIRLGLTKGLVTDFERFDQQLTTNSRKITALLDEHGPDLARSTLSAQS
ncbi:hypothetical protein DVG80_20670 [Rhodococcus erythropolis]|nr:hypothetical protein DVG80_20670 [Rhodococcus erythropolis]